MSGEMRKKGEPAPSRPSDAPARALWPAIPLTIFGAGGGAAVAALAAGLLSGPAASGTAGHGPTLFDTAQERVREVYNNLPIPFVHPPVVTARPAGAIAMPMIPPYPTTSATIGAPPPPSPPPHVPQITALKPHTTRASLGSTSPALPSRHSSNARALSGSSGPT